jgi:hypothetical protein
VGFRWTIVCVVLLFSISVFSSNSLDTTKQLVFNVILITFILAAAGYSLVQGVGHIKRLRQKKGLNATMSVTNLPVNFQVPRVFISQVQSVPMTGQVQQESEVEY